MCLVAQHAPYQKSGSIFHQASRGLSENSVFGGEIYYWILPVEHSPQQPDIGDCVYAVTAWGWLVTSPESSHEPFTKTGGGCVCLIQGLHKSSDQKNLLEMEYTLFWPKHLILLIYLMGMYVLQGRWILPHNLPQYLISITFHNEYNYCRKLSIGNFPLSLEMLFNWKHFKVWEKMHHLFPLDTLSVFGYLGIK